MNCTDVMEKRTIQTNILGEVSYDQDDVILFPEGLVGFENRNYFTVYTKQELEPFRWLTSVDNDKLCFPVIDPFLVIKDYNPLPTLDELKTIGLDDIHKAQILAIVTIDTNTSQVTVNLRGPVIINEARKIGKQFILIDSGYLLKQPLLIQK